MATDKWDDFLKPRPSTPERLKQAKRLRTAFWLLFLLVFVVLPIFRPIWS